MHGREGEEGMLEIVAGKDRKRSCCAQAAIEQALAESANQRERLDIGERAPGSACVALGKENLLGRRARPMHQPLPKLCRIRFKCVR